MFKKYFALMMTLAALLTASARAEVPTSQFGFSGWPCLNHSCATVPSFPTRASQAGKNTHAAPTETASPATQPPVSPTQAPSFTPEATRAPEATRTPSTMDDYTTQSASAQEQMMFNLINSDRKNNNLSPLTLDPELCRIARIKSCDMRDNHYFAHQSPTYGRVKDMLTSFGYAYNSAGENIAHHATTEKAQAAFLSSPDHRRNLLSSAWKKVGIGICFDQNGFVYVTQIFVR